jgi:16S rRNA (adenine1518-N6/adenine1519-N6)-dimethyltransferase
MNSGDRCPYPGDPLSEIRMLGLRPDRKMGQNFLTDKIVVGKITGLIPAKGMERYVEIGPGTGIITERIVKRDRPLIMIEKDRNLAAYLKDKFSTRNVEIITGDAIEVLKNREVLRGSYIYSNLPYGISSPFIGHLIDNQDFRDGDRSFIGACVMLQLEFARRLFSPPETKEYGRISVSFQNKFKGKAEFVVSRHSFLPEPKVDSMVVTFQPRDTFSSKPVDEFLYGKILNTVFSRRRKKMKNSLRELKKTGLDASKIRGYLDEKNLSDKRPEQIDPDIFIELSNDLSGS